MSSILITGFAQKFTKGADGLVAVDWVTWVPRHAPQSMSNSERVDRLNPANIKFRDDDDASSQKLMHMRAIWSEIEPAYQAWKEGREVPLNGTPLAAWPGITPEQADVFRLTGIRSIEQVRDMTDVQRSRVHLPNTRELQDLARIFLENSGAAAAAEREAAKDRQIEQMQEQMNAMQLLLEQNLAASNAGGGDSAELVDLRAQLDDLGVKYHHKAGAATLRELLAQNQQAA